MDNLMNRLKDLIIVAAVLCGCAGPVLTNDQTPTQLIEPPPANFASRFDAARKDPAQKLKLEALLKAMPKGGELHSHLSGAVSVDELLRIAKQKGYRLVFDSTGSEFCGFAYGNLKRQRGFNPTLAPVGCQNEITFIYKTVSDVEVPAGAAQLRSVHDVLTVEHNEGDGEPSGFKQFMRAFDSLDKLTDNPDNMGDLVASVMTDAYVNGVSYLELMLNPIGRDRVGLVDGKLKEITVPISETLDIIAKAIDRTKEALIYSANGYNTDHQMKLYGDHHNASANACR